MGVLRGWRTVPVPLNGTLSNVSALIVRRPMLVTDDERPRTYADLEHFVSSEDLLHLLAKTVQEQSAVIRELAENAREARRPKHKRVDKHLRQIARDVIQEELFEHIVDRPPLKRKNRAKVHLSYTQAEFDPKLREAIDELWDPANLEKLTVDNVLGHLHVSSANTLWGLLKDYGYARSDETLAKCLRRLADEWHPEWRGINRQRF